MSYKKIVQGVEPPQAPLSDFVGIIDVVEVQLGIQTGQPSVSERLDGLLADVRRGGLLGEGHVEVLVDAVERLRRVEAFLTDFWSGARPSGRTRA